ncbi:MAG TPA: hypothetical protein ENO29_09375, partial [Candidatus Aminicenantes bacterium]|nr:hypothetical protein [Candidatus Aminicenantes bacterium]
MKKSKLKATKISCPTHNSFDQGEKEDQDLPGEQIVEMPINGVLDLHTFQPKEVKELVNDYIEECLRRGLYDLRIIHGKGTGTLKAIVHSILKKHPA